MGKHGRRLGVALEDQPEQGSNEEVQEDSTGKLMKRLGMGWSGQAGCQDVLGKGGRRCRHTGRLG